MRSALVLLLMLTGACTKALPPVAKKAADPEKLSAVETAYKAGVLSKEEYEAKKKDLDYEPKPISAASWSSETNPKGFRIERPAGWTVDASDRMQIVARGTDGSLVEVSPFVKSGGSCRQYLESGLSQDRYPGVQFDAVQQRRQQPDEVVASFRYQNGRGAALCSLYRGSGMLFVIAAPADRFDAVKGDLVRIVKSVSFDAPKTQQQPEEMRYTRFVDPREGAFFLNMPAGWQAEGGLVRRSAIDVTGGVRMTSPDQSSYIFVGDERLWNCVTPQIFGGLPAVPEGQLYDAGYGTKSMVLRLQPPLAFGMNYLGQMQRQLGISGLAVKDRRDRPDIAAPYNEQAARFNANPMGPTRTGVAEISFAGQRNGRQVAGVLLILISVTPWMNGGAMWTPRVSGFVAPIEKAGAVGRAFWNVNLSFAVNPQWAQGQQKTTMATSRTVAQTSEQISSAISKSYWSTQAAYDRIYQSDSDARRGQVRLRDPETGEEFTAAAGHNYYYRPMAGDERHIFGTDNTDRPNIDATELLIVR